MYAYLCYTILVASVGTKQTQVMVSAHRSCIRISRLRSGIEPNNDCYHHISLQHHVRGCMYGTQCDKDWNIQIGSSLLHYIQHHSNGMAHLRRQNKNLQEQWHLYKVARAQAS